MAQPIAPTNGSSRKDGVIERIVSALTRAVYRDVQVHWTVPLAPDAPTVVVANHFGGFVDGLVLLNALERRPGIIARDAIWKVPVAGRLMTWIGGIPVHKPEDGGAASANDQMFGSCYDALRSGGHLLIFPEGVTRNDPSIARVKTGAARIALGARASGAEGVMIAPVGIHYEDKAALRSRVVVYGGRPIDVDDVAAELGEPPVDADNRPAVEALTAEIDVRLRRSAPDYADWQEVRALTDAAEVALRPRLADPGGPVPIGLRDRLANVLADRPAEQRTAIRDAMETYQMTLDGVGLTDRDVEERISTRRLLGTVVWQLLVGLLLLPFAAVGAVINVVPWLIVKAVGALRVAPSVMSTIKPIVAFLSFGVAWGLVIWWAIRTFGAAGGAAAFVLMPVYLAAVLLLAERAVLIGRVFVRWRAGKRRGSVAELAAEDRAAVVDAVLAV